MSVEDLSVDPGCVLPALRTEMGREEGIELESSSAERVANEQYLAYGVGYQLERDLLTSKPQMAPVVLPAEEPSIAPA